MTDKFDDFFEAFKDEIANAPVLSAAELGEHSMRSHAARHQPPREDGQHYDDCPCGVCQQIRAARPDPPPSPPCEHERRNRQALHAVHQMTDAWVIDLSRLRAILEGKP